LKERGAPAGKAHEIRGHKAELQNYRGSNEQLQKMRDPAKGLKDQAGLTEESHEMGGLSAESQEFAGSTEELPERGKEKGNPSEELDEQESFSIAERGDCQMKNFWCSSRDNWHSPGEDLA
jgi:hypothetical protein